MESVSTLEIELENLDMERPLQVRGTVLPLALYLHRPPTHITSHILFNAIRTYLLARCDLPYH